MFCVTFCVFLVFTEEQTRCLLRWQSSLLWCLSTIFDCVRESWGLFSVIYLFFLKSVRRWSQKCWELGSTVYQNSWGWKGKGNVARWASIYCNLSAYVSRAWWDMGWVRNRWSMYFTSCSNGTNPAAIAALPQSHVAPRPAASGTPCAWHRTSVADRQNGCHPSPGCWSGSVDRVHQVSRVQWLFRYIIQLI